MEVEISTDPLDCSKYGMVTMITDYPHVLLLFLATAHELACALSHPSYHALCHKRDQDPESGFAEIANGLMVGERCFRLSEAECVQDEGSI